MSSLGGRIWEVVVHKNLDHNYWSQNFALLVYMYGNFRTFKLLSSKTDGVQCMCIFFFNFKCFICVKSQFRENLVLPRNEIMS